MAEYEVSEHFAPFLKAKAELDAKIKAEGMIAAKAFFKEYFDKNPGIYGIMWAQYTPYFNDGDPCVFSIGSIATFSSKEEFEDDPDIYEHECYGKEPATSLNQIEDILKVIFGDHAQVKVTRENIEVEEYNHD